MDFINDTIDELGQSVSNAYTQYEDIVNYTLKFFAGFLLSLLLSGLGSAGGGTTFGIAIVVGILTLVSPIEFLTVTLGVVSCFFVFTSSIEASVFLLFTYVVLYLLYIRIFPKESLIIPIMLLAYTIEMPYLVPIFVGLFVGLRGVGAVIVAVLLGENRSMLNAIIEVSPKAGFSVSELLDRAISILEISVSQFSISSIFVMTIFSLVILVVSLINNFEFRNQNLIQISVGSLIMIIGILITNSLGYTEKSFFAIILGVVFSFVIAYTVCRLRYVLDYNRIEKVKFQDDNYVYYVKAVPKQK